MKVKDIMTKDPACCMPDSKLPDVARLMADRDCGGIPVVEDMRTMRPVGVVTDRDIIVRAVAEGKNPLVMTAREVMSSPAVTVTPDTKVDDACRTLADKRLRRLPVVDEGGYCSGIISQADIAKHAPEKLTAKVVQAVSEPV